MGVIIDHDGRRFIARTQAANWQQGITFVWRSFTKANVNVLDDGILDDFKIHQVASDAVAHFDYVTANGATENQTVKCRDAFEVGSGNPEQISYRLDSVIRHLTMATLDYF